jgi:hypothetical protein
LLTFCLGWAQTEIFLSLHPKYLGLQAKPLHSGKIVLKCMWKGKGNRITKKLGGKMNKYAESPYTIFKYNN